MDNQKYTFYKHTSITEGKSYIGITIDSLRERWREHVYSSKNPYSTTYTLFQHKIATYGEDDFTHEVLLTQHCSKEEAHNIEAGLIFEHQTLAPNGYNIVSNMNIARAASRKYRVHKGDYRISLAKLQNIHSVEFKQCRETGIYVAKDQTVWLDSKGNNIVIREKRLFLTLKRNGTMAQHHVSKVFYSAWARTTELKDVGYSTRYLKRLEKLLTN